MDEQFAKRGPRPSNRWTRGRVAIAGILLVGAATCLPRVIYHGWPWEVTQTNTPAPRPGYVAAWKVAPPRPQPSAAMRIPAAQPNPQFTRPLMDNPNGVNGSRPPRVVPSCTGQCSGGCGDDGCGRPCCPNDPNHVCVDQRCCERKCAPNACGGTDGCGGTCVCLAGKTCNNHQCDCTPSCVGATCGDSDGCGHTCKGTCELRQKCLSEPSGQWRCAEIACPPGMRSCGDGVCIRSQQECP
jgi:hypothetical protein